jgi:anti-sigma factor RsiW
MKKNAHTQLLLRSFDEALSAEAQAMLDTALAASPELRAEKARLEALREALAGQEYAFRPFFATRLMARLQRERETWASSLPFAFRRIALPALALVLLLLLTVVYTEQSLSFEALTGVSTLAVDDPMTQLFVSQ